MRGSGVSTWKWPVSGETISPGILRLAAPQCGQALPDRCVLPEKHAGELSPRRKPLGHRNGKRKASLTALGHQLLAELTSTLPIQLQEFDISVRAANGRFNDANNPQTQPPLSGGAVHPGDDAL